MAKHNILGFNGEQIAAEYMKGQGFTILHRNWRSGHKELDLVTTKDNLLVVIEVKTRYNDIYGLPQEAVDDRKIRKIISATDSYIRLFSIDMQVRFDIITIILGEKSFKIEHIEDAFFPPIW